MAKFLTRLFDVRTGKLRIDRVRRRREQNDGCVRLSSRARCRRATKQSAGAGQKSVQAWFGKLSCARLQGCDERGVGIDSDRLNSIRSEQRGQRQAKFAEAKERNTFDHIVGIPAD